ncbi:hypothetical protein [Kurthia sibirica]|uniref:Uncharacterized protein n=1 Tax=Kurthia sibirica TaxID=202750 RepID=A0A2U3AGN7_9BACL|nr:hypothetical protein [Kurthia sibirica]PWI23718.1 hypothetical protein DEX24_15605 [Kurthia sibirica]GEK35517.1 hypothetical protein KSI01_30500 [Kurthia sibirica]
MPDFKRNHIVFDEERDTYCTKILYGEGCLLEFVEETTECISDSIEGALEVLEENKMELIPINYRQLNVFSDFVSNRACGELNLNLQDTIRLNELIENVA